MVLEGCEEMTSRDENTECPETSSGHVFPTEEELIPTVDKRIREWRMGQWVKCLCKPEDLHSDTQDYKSPGTQWSATLALVWLCQEM